MPLAPDIAPKVPIESSVLSDVTPENERTVRTPLPASTVEPVNEKPSTVAPPVDTSKPASPAAPPEPPVNVKPETSNWKPATSLPKSYRTSNVPPGPSKAPNVKLPT